MDLHTSTTGSKVSDRWRAMRSAKRLEHLDGENDRLRTQLRMTRSQLDRERDRQQDVLDALKRAFERKTEIVAKPRGDVLRLVVVGGAAYLFGSKAGRKRYEKVRAWTSSVRDRLKGVRDAVDMSSPGIGPKPNPLTESGIRPIRHTGSIDASRRSA